VPNARDFVHQKTGSRKVPVAAPPRSDSSDGRFFNQDHRGTDALGIAHEDGSGWPGRRNDLSDWRNALSIIIRDAPPETTD